MALIRRRVSLGATCSAVGAGFGFVAWLRAGRRRRAEIRWAPPAGTVMPGPLGVRVLGSDGPTIVLLHGMAGSNRYWGAAYDEFASNGRLIVPDLLGFGTSPRPLTGYGPRWLVSNEVRSTWGSAG